MLTTQNQGGGKSAQAIVTILDDLDNPVSGASVTGDFSGGITETVTDNITDGQAVLTTTDAVKGRLKFMFCVTGVSGTPSYNPDDNVVELCVSN